jgi:hypothetical protein
MSTSVFSTVLPSKGTSYKRARHTGARARIRGGCMQITRYDKLERLLQISLTDSTLWTEGCIHSWEAVNPDTG